MQTANRQSRGSALSELARAALLGMTTVVGLAIHPVSANDSTASLDAGGLQFTVNPDIRIESGIFISVVRRRALCTDFTIRVRAISVRWWPFRCR